MSYLELTVVMWNWSCDWFHLHGVLNVNNTVGLLSPIMCTKHMSGTRFSRILFCSGQSHSDSKQIIYTSSISWTIRRMQNETLFLLRFVPNPGVARHRQMAKLQLRSRLHARITFDGHPAVAAHAHFQGGRVFCGKKRTLVTTQKTCMCCRRTLLGRVGAERVWLRKKKGMYIYCAVFSYRRPWEKCVCACVMGIRSGLVLHMVWPLWSRFFVVVFFRRHNTFYCHDFAWVLPVQTLSGIISIVHGALSSLGWIQTSHSTVAKQHLLYTCKWIFDLDMLYHLILILSLSSMVRNSHQSFPLLLIL